MVKRVIWGAKATKKYLEITLYFRENIGSQQAADNFSDTLFEKLEVLKKYPESGRLVKYRKTIRYVTIQKHYKIFYRTIGSTMHIAAVFDTRQDPYFSPF